MNIGDGNGKVYLGIPRERIYLTQFVDNRDSMLAYLHEKGLDNGYFQAEGHRVDRNRDRICHEFLKSEAEWLLMIDTDMEHPVNLAERLMRWKKPIVAGLYFHRGNHDPFAFRYVGEMPDEYNRPCPMWAPMRDEVYDFLMMNGVPLRDGAITINGADATALTECDAVATGAMLLHRSVIETMKPPWFEYITGGNSEDMIFCKIAKEQYGFPIYCDFSTISGHYHWVAMGQVQFRMSYENRGINLTAYSKREACQWYARFLDIPYEQAQAEVEAGSAHVAGDYWREVFGDSQPTPKQVEHFYESEETGRRYLMELLWWNFTPGFNNLRRTLAHLRGLEVMDLGAGIGSVALQLLIQKNNVLAVEVNPLLQQFIAMRYKELAENIESSIGSFTICGEQWLDSQEDESLDAVTAFDVMEHLPKPVLLKTVKHIARVLKPHGHFFYHNNFSQQDLYPMHYDHANIWTKLLGQHGFAIMSPFEAVKVGAE